MIVLEVAWLLLLEPQKPSMLLETPSRPETILGCRSFPRARFFQLKLEGFGGCPLPLVLGNYSSLSRFRQNKTRFQLLSLAYRLAFTTNMSCPAV